MKELDKFIRHLRIEALSLALLMVVLTRNSGYSLWVLPVTFIFFDVGMIGYLRDPKTGALLYNATHSHTIPSLLIASGVFFHKEAIAVIGFCWTFHIAIDRGLGFGLKHKSSFHKTHLGTIGKKKK